MEHSIKRLDTIYTADEQELGQALRIYVNPDPNDVDPKLKLFGKYLEVSNAHLGDTFYVPTDYIREAGEGDGRVLLTLNMKQVQNELLTREPQFIALGRAEKHELHTA